MKPKFYRNYDNNHCLQCCLLMVYNSICGKKLELDLHKVDEITKYDPSLWTWTIAGAMFLSKKFSDVRIINKSFDYKKFILEGENYLLSLWPIEFFENQKRNASKGFSKEQELASIFLNSGGVFDHGELNQGLFDDLLSNNFLIPQIDHGSVYGLKNNISHFVLLYSKDDDHFLIHDPGLPEKMDIRTKKSNVVGSCNELLVVPKPVWFEAELVIDRNDPCVCDSGLKNKKCHDLS